MPNKRIKADLLNHIHREHLLKAIKDIDDGVAHAFGESTDFDLIHAGKRYPPKAVLGVAGRYALNMDLLPEHFSAGETSACFRILRQEGFEIVQKKRAFLLTWNPEEFSEAAFRKELQDFESGEAASIRWSIGRRKDLPIGSALFLMRLGTEPRGIVGTALSTESVEEDLHWKAEKANEGVQARYVAYQPIRMQEEPFLPLTLLQAEWPNFDWTPQSSGVEIHDPTLIAFLSGECEEDLTVQISNELDPEEIHIEGAVSQILVNAYERDPKARKRCLKHHGTRCAACGKTMEEIYGPIGKDIIHVHHRKPLHTIGEAYKLDPIQDLVPVCPNCHAVLHRTKPAMAVEDLKTVIGLV
ncbi:MAG: HNH endonuclease [Rectinemataceae bacterium]|nr:HNH endonuclease [Rectinemataceae bacterium]